MSQESDYIKPGEDKLRDCKKGFQDPQSQFSGGTFVKVAHKTPITAAPTNFDSCGRRRRGHGAFELMLGQEHKRPKETKRFDWYLWIKIRM